MAASGEETVLGLLSQEGTCPLCQNFFEQPMGLACGHHFCRNCLAQLGTEASCPQCGAKVEPGSAYPSQALANIVHHLKRDRLPGRAQSESSGCRLCREHGQPLQSFCSSEKSLLCSHCLGSHQGHPLLSLPQAAKEYKDLLDGQLEHLRKERQKLLQQKQAEEQSWQKCQEQFAAEKKEVSLVLESLQQLLRERQSVWVAWLAEQEAKMEAEWRVPLAQLSREASCLQQLVGQTERKCHQPAGELLQDIQETVDRCLSHTVGRMERVSPRLQSRVRTLLEKNASVRQSVDSYKASLQTTLTRENLERLLATAPAPEEPRYSKVFVTLNASTAHPHLWCQGSKVICTSEYQKCPNAPERFDWELCALGYGGFTTGQHWWEVSVLDARNARVMGRACWAIGVAKESVRRKGSFQLSPQEGIWAVGEDFGGKIIAFSEFQEAVSWGRPLQRLRVRLGYEAETVEFQDAETEISFYVFKTGPFLGETVYPFFYLGLEGLVLQCEKYPCSMKGIREW